jgi:glycosyltransferase involved in cell wall biosynthesis
MSKVLIIGPFPGSSKGISNVNLFLYKALQKKGWRVHKINTEFSKKIILSSVFSINNFKIFYRFLESYKIFFVDYVYITIGISFFGILKYAPFIFVAKICNKKLIVHVHSNYLETIYNELPNYRKKIVFKILHSFNSGIVLSKSLVNNLTLFLPNENIFIVENFISNSLLTSPADKDYSEIRLIFMTNLLESKGINDLLQALILLKNEGVVFKVKIAGNKDDSNNLDDLFKALPHVEYLGEVKNQDKIDLLTWGNVFCLPISFKYEGQPISLIEGMAFKNLILSTEYEGMKDICTSKNAVFCNEKNPEDLKNKLLYIRNNWITLKEIAIKNGDYARENFSEKKFLDTVINVFKATKC